LGENSASGVASDGDGLLRLPRQKGREGGKNKWRLHAFKKRETERQGRDSSSKRRGREVRTKSGLLYAVCGGRRRRSRELPRTRLEQVHWGRKPSLCGQSGKNGDSSVIMARGI